MNLIKDKILELIGRHFSLAERDFANKEGRYGRRKIGTKTDDGVACRFSFVTFSFA